MNVAGSGVGPLLNHLEDDVGAGGVREAGELFERLFGIVPLRSPKGETDERGAFARLRR